MAILSALKLSNTVKPRNIPAVQLRRIILSNRLWEQIQLATAQQTGTEFAPMRTRSYKDTETAIRKQITASKRVKQWWFTAENGKLIINVRYGARVIELAKGKTAVEVASMADLVQTRDRSSRQWKLADWLCRFLQQE